MGFSRQEYWSGLPFPSAGDLPHSGIKLRSPALQADSVPSEPPGKPCLTYLVAFIFQLDLDLFVLKTFISTASPYEKLHILKLYVKDSLKRS